MLWSVGLANICLAQVSAMGVPSAEADSTQTQMEFLLVHLKNDQRSPQHRRSNHGQIIAFFFAIWLSVGIRQCKTSLFSH